MDVARTTLLIDPGGRIAQVWRGGQVDGHAEEVLAAAKALEPPPVRRAANRPSAAGRPLETICVKLTMGG
jgi:hypothetical protein